MNLLRATVLAVAMTAGWAEAATITFGTTTINPLTTYSEGGFTFTTISGSSTTCISDSIGNPVGSLSQGCSVPTVGSTLEVTRDGGGQFAFTSFDRASLTNVQSDTMRFVGFVGNGQTQELAGVFATTNTWATVQSGFTAPIDRLRLVITALGSTALILDNLVLTPVDTAVPEPGTWALMGLGLGVVGLMRRRQG